MLEERPIEGSTAPVAEAARRTAPRSGSAAIAAPPPDAFFADLGLRVGRLFTRSNWGLLVELVRAEFKASEYNSVLGLLWSLLGPGAMLGLMYAVFSRNFGSAVPSYPLYLLLGIVFVNFFVMATRQLIAVLPNNAELLLTTTAPRETLILSKLAIHAYKFLFELLLCAGASVFYGLFSWSTALLVIPLLVGYAGLVLGVGLLLALAYTFSRDVEHIWTIVARLLFFATPVFYGLDSLSDVPRALLYWLNPLTPFLVAFRAAFMGPAGAQWDPFWHSLLLGVVAFAAGYAAFFLFGNTAVERA